MSTTKKRKKTRVGATVQLVVGEDDDLIAWLNNIPANEKNRTLKTQLRLSLKLPLPIANNGGTPSSAADTEQAAVLYRRIEDLERQTQELAHYINHQLGDLKHPEMPRESPVVKEAEQLSRPQIDQRVARLRGAQW